LKASDPARATRFLDTVWPVAQRAADFVQGSAMKSDNFGFGAKDFSIWEEAPEYVVFTQTTFASGLHAAQLLAQERQYASKAPAWARARGSIAAAIFRDPSIAPCPGAWDSFRSDFVRGVWPDCSLDQRVDSSTDLLWVFGLLDAKDPRATEHRRAMLALLNQLGLFDPRLP